MSKYLNLAIFFDGTWNDDSSETNVWKLRGDTRLGTYSFEGESDEYTTEALYETGPGTSADMSIYGGAFAGDLDKALIDAYAWVSERIINLKATRSEQIPQLFLFGFSRGAYRAHVFSWLLNDVGIPNDFSKCRDIAAAYAKHNHREVLELTQDGVIHAPAIKMLGLWDVVSAPLDKYGNFQNHIRSPLVENLYHAMAANERRVNFPVMQYCPTIKGTVQTWFSGAHSDVGGGYPPKERERSDIALAWMKYHAMECGLDFLSEQTTAPDINFNKLRKIHDEAYRITKPHRSFLRGELIHASLAMRRKQIQSYIPEVLQLPKSITTSIIDAIMYRWKS